MPSRLAPNRLTVRRIDVHTVQRAGPAIADLETQLDAQLAFERRPAERLRMLRETTNRITRTANDAVQAYRRAIHAVNAERDRPDANLAAAEAMAAHLESARDEVLRALDVARRRYPAALEAAIEADPAPKAAP